MEKKKPLRQSTDKIKDVFNTYVKNDDRKQKTNTEEDILEDNFEDLNIDSESDNSSNKAEMDSKTEEFEFKIDDLEKEIANLKDQLIRKAAEMDNYRRRMQKERSELIEFANADLLSKLIEIPDDIANAYKASIEENASKESLLQGIEMIHNKAKKLFNEAGVKQMENLEGKEFDVEYHEALLNQASDTIPEGHIISVLQPGYLLKDKVLRHAKVIISSGKE